MFSLKKLLLVIFAILVFTVQSLVLPKGITYIQNLSVNPGFAEPGLA